MAAGSWTQCSETSSQPRGSRAGATARTRAKAARAPPRADPTPLPEPCVAAQSLPGRGRCPPPHPVHPSRLPASPPAREAGLRPAFRPARPGPALRRRPVRARGAGPVPLPNVRAPHAQCAPAVSVCLNRKADILVPHGPPRPTPSARAFAARLALSPAGAAAPLRSFPQPQPLGPDARLSSPPARQPVLPPSLHRAPASPCPAGHRGSSPSSSGTKWESEAVPWGTSSWPRRIGASGRAEWSRGCGARAPPAPQSGAGPARGPSGGGGGSSWHSSAPALRSRLSSSPSPAARGSLHPASLSLSRLLPVSAPGTLHGEGGRGPLGCSPPPERRRSRPS
ncbi:skin secretory protein xP2-like [Moschus berezovskii]|uniref:skin secretory protein xP2-like n=1 Tax=Moschus berezovskii TaxID=68408 RepID=UPI002443BD0D|nr:skin secretory protein xP2-like [Moschus berezovskii]